MSNTESHFFPWKMRALVTIFGLLLIQAVTGQARVPEISSQSPETVATGTSVTLTCNVEKTTDTLVFEWLNSKGNIPQQTEKTYSPPSDHANTDTYTCKVTDTSGMSSTSKGRTQTFVKPANKPMISVDTANPKPTDTVTLTCETTGDSTIDAYAWYKNGSLVTEQTSMTLTFTNIQSDSSGSYKCKALVSGIESEESNAYALNVTAVPEKPRLTFSPTSITKGSTITLTCSSATESSLTLTYKWELNLSPLPDTTKTLTISSFAVDVNDGTYKCAAVNSGVTSAYSDEKIIVLDGAPERPTLTSSPSTFNITTQVTLTCQTSTAGITTFSYAKNRKAIAGQTNNTLVIASFSSDDAGAYTCQAVSDNGIASASSAVLTLSLNVAPNKPTLTVSPTTFNIGASVTISCQTTSADSSITYQYLLNGRAIYNLSGASNTISTFSSSHTGTYTCTATRNGLTSEPSNGVKAIPKGSPLGSVIISIDNGTVSGELSKASGSNLSMTCDAKCEPTCNFSWVHSNSTIVQSAALTLFNLKSSHEGQYTCNAINSVGSDTASFTLKVTGGAETMMVTFFSLFLPLLALLTSVKLN